MESIDRDPGKVDYVVNSHLHFDHAGGNELIPNATLVVQKREWRAAQDPEIAVKVGFFKADIDHGHPVKQVEGEHDLFGDGSVVCIPTYGHTPGHQSLKVRTEKGEIVLTGDACYFCRTLRERRLPRFVYDREQMLASLDRLAALENGGATLFFGHDPEFWKDVPQAPAPALYKLAPCGMCSFIDVANIPRARQPAMKTRSTCARPPHLAGSRQSITACLPVDFGVSLTRYLNTKRPLPL